MLGTCILFSGALSLAVKNFPLRKNQSELLVEMLGNCAAPLRYTVELQNSSLQKTEQNCALQFLVANTKITPKSLILQEALWTGMSYQQVRSSSALLYMHFQKK